MDTCDRWQSPQSHSSPCIWATIIATCARGSFALQCGVNRKLAFEMAGWCKIILESESDKLMGVDKVGTERERERENCFYYRETHCVIACKTTAALCCGECVCPSFCVLSLPVKFVIISVEWYRAILKEKSFAICLDISILSNLFSFRFAFSYHGEIPTQFSEIPVYKINDFINERELKFMFVICHRRPSVCLSSVCLSVVCNVRAPYSGDWNFRQYFYAMWYTGHPWPLYKNFTEIVPGEPSVGGVKHKRGSRI